MRRRDNPYKPGFGQKPPYLVGRASDLEDLRGLIELLSSGGAGRSPIYFGQVGVGKTVLLIELDTLASELGWATTGVQEIRSRSDFRETFAQMAARLLREISRRHRMEERVERALGIVKSFGELTAGRISSKLDVDAVIGSADGGDPEQDLVDLVREIGEVARAAGTGALFVLDEMQNLDAVSLSALSAALYAVRRNVLPVGVVGAGLPDLPARLMTEKPYADRLFDHRELGPLPETAACVALTQPAAELGVAFEHKAALEVARLSGGFPYLLQEYGHELWNAAETSPITMGNVEESRDQVRDQLARTFYGTRFALATDAERRYLTAMASLGAPPYSSADVARAWGADNQRATSPHRDRLIQKGLICSPERGKVDFTVPLFTEYLLEFHVLSNFENISE